MIVDTEKTGSVTRVIVAAPEDEAADEAREHLGLVEYVTADVVWWSEGDVFEVIFENADLA